MARRQHFNIYSSRITILLYLHHNVAGRGGGRRQCVFFVCWRRCRADDNLSPSFLHSFVGLRVRHVLNAVVPSS